VSAAHLPAAAGRAAAAATVVYLRVWLRNLQVPSEIQMSICDDTTCKMDCKVTDGGPQDCPCTCTGQQWAQQAAS
jgi:hypothetical protein